MNVLPDQYFLVFYFHSLTKSIHLILIVHTVKMLHENMFKGGRKMHNRIRIAKAIIVKYFKFLVLFRVEDGLPDLPGGKLKEGEGFEQGLLRELSAETGLVVGKPVPVNQWILPTAKGMSNGMTFCCNYVRGGVVLSHEHADFSWLNLDEIKWFTPHEWVRGFFNKYIIKGDCYEIHRNCTKQRIC
jgi:8-oxo-dGTP pyrophosphatase MutT (NUDIX family)